jgi:hypothetical protein
MKKRKRAGERRQLAVKQMEFCSGTFLNRLAPHKRELPHDDFRRPYDDYWHRAYYDYWSRAHYDHRRSDYDAFVSHMSVPAASCNKTPTGSEEGSDTSQKQDFFHIHFVSLSGVKLGDRSGLLYGV